MLDFCVLVQAAVLILGILMEAVDLESAPEHRLWSSSEEQAGQKLTQARRELGARDWLFFFFFFLFIEFVFFIIFS